MVGIQSLGRRVVVVPHAAQRHRAWRAVSALEDRTVKWFGESWGAPVCKPENHAATPTAPCAHCNLAFRKSDSGIILPFAGGPGDPPELPYHRLCLLWQMGIGVRKFG